MKPPACCMLRASSVSDGIGASQWQGSVRQSSFLVRTHVASKAGYALPTKSIRNHVLVSLHVNRMY